MPSLRQSFGHRLREIRIERELSQESFAEFVGISVDFLSLIERGINAPTFETIEQIARRLGLPVKALFEFPERRREVVPTANIAMTSASCSSRGRCL
jgi:transcriptional regulator with XRE-family HTH domain